MGILWARTGAVGVYSVNSQASVHKHQQRVGLVLKRMQIQSSMHGTYVHHVG